MSMMRVAQAEQELFEALEELRMQTVVVLRQMQHPSDAVDDALDGELAKKMKLVTESAENVRRAIDEAEEARQNRTDGYGSV